MYITLILKSGKENNLKRKHPWIFSGAIKFLPKGLNDGDIVRIESSVNEFLGIGHYQGGGSIAVRLLTFNDEIIDQLWWKQTILGAYSYRKALGLIHSESTNAFRLFHGEGDGVPGLIIDVYNNIAVIQSHSIGVHKSLQNIADAVVSVFDNTIDTVYSKCKDTLPEQYGMTVEDGIIIGNNAETVIKENEVKFYIDVHTGQKTGFFLDQRDNRKMLGDISHGKSVLNCFCYTGGFSMYALQNGASEVISVDISQKAMDIVDQNVDLNGYKNKHASICANVMHYLGDDNVEPQDIVIVDPPAFAKSLHKRHNAVQAYKRLNILALKKVKSGGILMTFSCSQVVGTQLFYDTIVAAGIESGRNIRVMHSLSQGADHPINLYHPEGHYLKGLILYVE